MEMPSLRWVPDLGMEDPAFFDQSQMNTFDDFTSQHIAAAAFGDDLNRSFSSESYSSYSTLNQKGSTTTFSGSSMERIGDRPTKNLKNNSWNSLPTPEASSSPPNVLSFGGLASPIDQPQQLYGNLIGTVKPKDEVVIFSSSDAMISEGSYMSQSHGSKGGQGIKRLLRASKPASHTQEHVLAERKRREKLSQRFIALAALVPDLKKIKISDNISEGKNVNMMSQVDKASILGDSIKYLKQLQQRMKILEEQAMKKTIESVVVVKRSQISADYGSSSSEENFISDDPLPEVEVRVSDKNILVRIHCQKQKGVLVKTLAEIEKLHLCVVHSSATPFCHTALDITIVAKMEEDFCMKVKDLVRHLHSAFRQFMLQ